MKKPDESQEAGFSRRDFFKHAGALSITAAGAASLPILPTSEAANPPAPPQEEVLRAIESLTAQQFATLTAITGRIIPSDASGPGAIEAHVAAYIDRALNSHYNYRRDNYSANLSVLDDYCKAKYEAAFSMLSPEKQDAVLTAMEGNKIEKSFGFVPDAATFFNLVLEHTQEGMFSDPYYGGNADFIGWDLVDFPGVKLSFDAEEQQLDHPITKAHRSAYSYDIFNGGNGSHGH